MVTVKYARWLTLVNFSHILAISYLFLLLEHRCLETGYISFFCICLLLQKQFKVSVRWKFWISLNSLTKTSYCSLYCLYLFKDLCFAATDDPFCGRTSYFVPSTTVVLERILFQQLFSMLRCLVLWNGSSYMKVQVMSMAMLVAVSANYIQRLSPNMTMTVTRADGGYGSMSIMTHVLGTACIMIILSINFFVFITMSIC